VALKLAARRLVAKKRLAVPRRGFFVIVPLEYSVAGAPPPSWFVDDLMNFEKARYYVGLLSAAALYGAAHQQPQEFHIVTDKQLRPTTAGRSRLRFFAERLDPHALAHTASVDVELSIVQRTGYLLDHLGAKDKTGPLAEWLATRRPRRVLLRAGSGPRRGEADSRWAILKNEDIEAEP
jgi:predicted transcriptional regulator of viral defense system